MADLYVGTSSSSLSLLTSTMFGSIAPGRWNQVNTTVNGIAGGGVVFIITQIRDAGTTPRATLPAAAAGSNPAFAYGSIWATSLEFQFTLGTSPIMYPNMYSANGNWPVGTFDMSGVDGSQRTTFTGSNPAARSTEEGQD